MAFVLDQYGRPIRSDGRLQGAAESLFNWANQGYATDQRPISSVDQALEIVRQRGSILDPYTIPDLNMSEAHNQASMGRFSPEVQAARDVYHQFYGVGSAANGLKIEAALAGQQQQSQQPGSGGNSLIPDSWQVADAASQVLPLTQSATPAPDLANAAITGQSAARSRVRLAAPGSFSVSGQEDLYGYGSSPSLADDVNVSGGGPGTSTAKGDATIARQAARRGGGGKGFLGAVDDFIAKPGHSVGVVAQSGLRNYAAMAHKAGMPGVAGMLKGLAPAARWAAPVGLFAATTGLPAVMGAIEGNEKAGVGGAVLQGGGALAGAAIGQALIPIPVVGAGIGAMVGNAVGSGLSGLAQGAVEKAQMGDTSFVGGIGRALDPLIDTSFEKEQKAVMQEMNSPAMQAIRQQEYLRNEQARIDQRHSLLMQAATRSMF
jgi:hypothetical protein